MQITLLPRSGLWSFLPTQGQTPHGYSPLVKAKRTSAWAGLKNKFGVAVPATTLLEVPLLLQTAAWYELTCKGSKRRGLHPKLPLNWVQEFGAAFENPALCLFSNKALLQAGLWRETCGRRLASIWEELRCPWTSLGLLRLPREQDEASLETPHRWPRLCTASSFGKLSLQFPHAP